MNILFIHQNFPGQFKFLAPELAKNPGNRVAAISMNNFIDSTGNINSYKYRPQRGSTKNIHPWVIDFETKIIRAEECVRLAAQIKKDGFTPDIIFAHPGWGESLFLKDVWPKAKLIIYCEFHYKPLGGGDTAFDKEFLSKDPLGDICRLRIKNINNEMHFNVADYGISPTEWQKSTFPPHFKDKITVIHDGIDTSLLRPQENVSIQIGDKTFTKSDQIITFVNRNLEPYRGYHTLMRALPKILKENKSAQVLIIGGDNVSYGVAPENNTWKNIFLDEVRDKLDLSRVHFLGHISYEKYIACLRISSCHIYLTYPFVLSWSLLEAMSLECPIIASKTSPLLEVINDYKNGIYVDFFNPDDLASKVLELLDNKNLRKDIGGEARLTIISNYDLKSICLPRQLTFLKKIVH